MRRSWGRLLSSTAFGLFILIGLACSSTAQTPVPDSTSAPTSAPTSTPTFAPTSAPAQSPPDTPQTPVSSSIASVEPTATRQDAAYDPSNIMYRIFPGFNDPFQSASLTTLRLDSQRTITALEEVRERNDISQVPVIVESMRFYFLDETVLASGEALQELTDQNFGADWPAWMEWLGKNSDAYPPPDKYLRWKRDVLSGISPRFSLFLRDDNKTSRINLTEVVWGGVLPDGIPDLQNPPHIAGNEADYLEPDERVFGVSINGEHRAYPLRIVNAHEMANDVLGGETIALAY